MGQAKRIFDSLVSVLSTCLTFAFGTWDMPLTVIAVFIGLDYLTGIAAAAYEKKLSSSVGYRGLLKKAGIFAVIIVGVMLDRLTGSGQWVFRSIVCYFYAANEGLSILENIGRLGLPMPVKVKDALAKLKEGN